MRRQLLEWGEMSSLMVPLVVGGEVVGSLEVSEVVYPRHFTEQEIALCVALGEQAAVAIHNAQLYRRCRSRRRPSSCRRPSTVSPGSTTTASSGSACATRSRGPGATASRSRCSCSTWTTSSDVNDRFGHPVGDELLRAVGQALQTQVRQGVDCAARYGGEEFAVILPSTESELESGAPGRRGDHRGAHPRAPSPRLRAAARRLRLARHHREHRRGHPAGARRRRRGPGGARPTRRSTGQERAARTRSSSSAPEPLRRGTAGLRRPPQPQPLRLTCRRGSRTSRRGSRRTRGRSTASASTRTPPPAKNWSRSSSAHRPEAAVAVRARERAGVALLGRRVRRCRRGGRAGRSSPATSASPTMIGVEMAPPFQIFATCTGVLSPFSRLGPATVASLITSCETT